MAAKKHYLILHILRFSRSSVKILPTRYYMPTWPAPKGTTYITLLSLQRPPIWLFFGLDSSLQSTTIIRYTTLVKKIVPRLSSSSVPFAVWYGGLIERLEDNGIFDLSEIAIQTPYRKQNNCYRTVMAKASMAPFWVKKGRKIPVIDLMTVNSFKGVKARVLFYTSEPI